ncbi:hypothetical protein FN846DRAFT_888563 [Sphaerosporella brunnea]|uniref:Uncharacterized protein n=1 Tax=Sphaerosporella brunnea TaxID=1250544 RepID=A0A5J5F2L6_9PEZI|nr:hypothetical protein FN846DRAFT_888563 [Sphaerosporella brunnea]
MPVPFVDAFLRRIVQGLAAADPDNTAVALPDADAQDTVPSDVKKHKRKCEAMVNTLTLTIKSIRSDVPKLKNASDCVPLPASAVQGNTTTINVEVHNYQGVDIAWDLNANGTLSAVTISFGGSTS